MSVSQPLQSNQIKQQTTYKDPVIKNKMHGKMITCKTCGNLIAKTAKRCPYCGAKQHQVALTACYLILIFMVIAIVAVMVNGTDSDSTVTNVNSALNSSQTVSNLIANGAIKVNCETLYKDYESNAINADKKYRGKKLVLTGTIANIDRDIAQNPYITFNVDEYGAEQIKMSFNDDDTVAKLKKGQKVTVVGNCSGTFTSSLVVLDNCSIVNQ